jgi:hypothetical protein
VTFREGRDHPTPRGEPIVSTCDGCSLRSGHGSATVFPKPTGTAALPMHTPGYSTRAVLSDETYESLAHEGETMTIAEMATYAYDQIDPARTELNAVS